jgi:hypothetical protein
MQIVKPFPVLLCERVERRSQGFACFVSYAVNGLAHDFV